MRSAAGAPKRAECGRRGEYPDVSGARHASNKLSAIVRRDGPHCALCGHYVVGKSRTVDHIIPRRDGGTKDLANLRMTHRACNQARDEHYRLDHAETLEHLEALCDMARCIDALYPGIRWRFARLPDAERAVYEIAVFAQFDELETHRRKLEHLEARLQQRYGSCFAFTVTADAHAARMEPAESIMVAFPKNDRLTLALQMMAERHGKSSFVNSVRHAIWSYLAQSEPEIYRRVSKPEYLRIYRPDLIEDPTVS